MLAVVPDDDPDPDRHHEPDDVAPSLWEEFAEQAVAAFVIALPDPHDPGLEREWTLRAPHRDGVAALDEQRRPLEQLADLIGDDLVTDQVVEALDRLDWEDTLDLVGDLRAHFALPDLPAGMWTVLVEQIDCYGTAIEADLFDRGADLLDWFRGHRPWQQLARLLARLPEGSRYRAAILDDEDLAEQRIAQGLERPTDRSLPPLEGETQDRMLLRAVVSALLRVEHAVFAVNAKKGKAGKPPRPLPGPQTAEDRVREAYADADVEDIFDQVTPWWRDESVTDAPDGHHMRDSGLIVPD